MGNGGNMEGDHQAGWASAGSSRSGDLDAPRRRLFHIPVIHSQAEMGSLSPAIQAMTVRRLGAEGWERNVSLIDNIWTRIEEAIDRWSLPCQQTRLYQDGLPVCGRELEIVSELAKAGSRNHQLLLRLKERGAIIMGTESADLLVQEYHLSKRLLAAGGSASAARWESRHGETRRVLLERRDRAIAERINHTLCRGEIGLLFLGMLHSVEGWLDRDIQVAHPLYPPPGGNS
jgi:hypothetical protein